MLPEILYGSSRRGHNFQTKRPIEKLRPLSTLQLLILATGAHFQAVLSTFEGKFATFQYLIFCLWHPLVAGMAGWAVLVALGGPI